MVCFLLLRQRQNALHGTQTMAPARAASSLTINAVIWLALTAATATPTAMAITAAPIARTPAVLGKGNYAIAAATAATGLAAQTDFARNYYRMPGDAVASETAIADAAAGNLVSPAYVNYAHIGDDSQGLSLPSLGGFVPTSLTAAGQHYAAYAPPSGSSRSRSHTPSSRNANQNNNFIDDDKHNSNNNNNNNAHDDDEETSRGKIDFVINSPNYESIGDGVEAAAAGAGAAGAAVYEFTTDISDDGNEELNYYEDAYKHYFPTATLTPTAATATTTAAASPPAAAYRTQFSPSFDIQQYSNYRHQQQPQQQPYVYRHRQPLPTFDGGASIYANNKKQHQQQQQQLQQQQFHFSLRPTSSNHVKRQQQQLQLLHHQQQQQLQQHHHQPRAIHAHEPDHSEAAQLQIHVADTLHTGDRSDAQIFYTPHGSQHFSQQQPLTEQPAQPLQHFPAQLEQQPQPSYTPLQRELLQASERDRQLLLHEQTQHNVIDTAEQAAAKPHDHELPPVSTTIRHTAASAKAVAGLPLAQHIDITKHVPVAQYHKQHVPYRQAVEVPVPRPVITTVPRPLPIKVPVSKTVAVPQLQEVKIPIEKVKPFPVERPIPFVVERRVPYRVEKPVATPVYYPYPIKVPIVRTVVHKVPALRHPHYAPATNLPEQHPGAAPHYLLPQAALGGGLYGANGLLG